VIFAQLFRDAFKGAASKVDFEKIRGVRLDQRSPSSFSDEERGEMLDVFDENWADQDQVAAESFRGDLERGFDSKNENTHFYLTKKDGKIIGFIRFDERNDLEPGAYYAGSFNVRPEYRGSAVGDAMMDKTLEHEAKEHVLYAHVVADAAVGARYVENGLVVTGVKWIEKDGDRVADLAIRQDNKKNDQYRARKDGITHDKLLIGVPGVRVRKFDYLNEKENFLRAIEEAAVAGEVVSRYWTDPKDSNTRYIAIEPDVETTVVSEAA